ncbi:uncharacterized protein LOC116342898 [Contarinia nasturtii]|uniref:uncharacterized protein LOC116342898 n=1 Tax=Contarinia nasturtii TaxID=265458 RepID=UPI0012D44ACC|nr:uncharacterized protein LOC116342898 [Contarinia nasturtii]XP_031626683.1 uncharacterized protein LOC116342898 [Contarinia nasturtii]
MWSNEDSNLLIETIESQVLTTIPITSTNNNHEFTGNIHDIIHDWDQIANKVNRSVIDCQRQWNSLIRTFLFATNRVNTDQNDMRRSPVYAIHWRNIEKMMFLIPYIGKYKRYESSTEQQKTDMIVKETCNKMSKQCEYDKITPQMLRDIVKEMLKTKSTPECAKELIKNLKKFCQNESYLDKLTYMIELNTKEWDQRSKQKFLQWYHKHLRKIEAKP